MIQPLLPPAAMAAIVEQAFQVLQAALELAEGRTGGYLCVADLETGLPVILVPFGSAEPGEAEKTCRYAQEKPRRLAAHPDHLSSWQSRAPQDKQWGGAVRGARHIFTFSGFPELVDEAAMLVLAVSAGELSEAEASAIAEISGNPLLQPLLAARG